MSTKDEVQMMLEQGLLVDPSSHEPLVLSEDGKWLEAHRTMRRFPLNQGIPRMTEASAESLDKAGNGPDTAGA